MARNPRTTGPLTAAQLDVFLSRARGDTLHEIALRRGCMSVSCRTQLQEACRKLGIKAGRVVGCLETLTPEQNRLLNPLEYVRGERQDQTVVWPPEKCPTCGQSWPCSPEFPATTVTLEPEPAAPGAYRLQRDGEPAESARTVIVQPGGSIDDAPEGLFG